MELCEATAPLAGSPSWQPRQRRRADSGVPDPRCQSLGEGGGGRGRGGEQIIITVFVIN